MDKESVALLFVNRALVSAREILSETGLFVVKRVDSAIETRQREIAQKLGFELQEHALALYGNCTKKNCQLKKK